MDKRELGAFLRSRRERLRPRDVGLPSGARRRTPGLRREEVAVLAHISTEYYVRLERHDVQAAPTLTKTFRHPAVGEITLDCDSLKLTDRDQHLVLYTAPPGSPDADALALLHMLGTERINSATA